MHISKMIYSVAEEHEGTWEWKDGHNPQVVAYYAASGHPEIKEDEVPWCAAFVGAVLAQCGLPNTGSLLARSYLDYGEKVLSKDVVRGDIVVLKRGNSSWQGHVGFVSRIANGKVYVLGGNQGNQVNVTGYPLTSVLGYRRASEVKVPRKSPAQSTTLQATAATAAAGAGGVASVLGALTPTGQIIVLVCAAVALLGLGWIARERLKRWAKGDR